jgi:anti-sigma factor RsiW
MASCQDLDRLLTPYLDAEVTPQEKQDVERHLGVCPPCARRAAAEGAARRIVMVRAEALSVRAPERLRARCLALAPCRRRRWWAMPAWRSLGLATASLAVLLVVGAVVGALAHSPTVLAAELSLDHMKCFALFEPRGGRAADPVAVSRQLEADYGWHLKVPASLPDQRLTLLGARRCFSTDGRVAHVLYRHGGRPVSLFMLPRTTYETARVAVGAAGRATQIWSRGSTTYVLLGDESEREMSPIADYFLLVTASDGTM